MKHYVKTSKMFPLKLLQLRSMTLHQWRCTAQTRKPAIAVLDLLPRIDGYAHFSSGNPSRAGLPHFERIAIRHESIPASKYLAGTVLTPDPTRVEQAQVIKRLPSLLFPLHGPLRACIFFITPEYAKWFDEDNEFLQNALDHIYEDWSTSMQKASNPSLANNSQLLIQTRVAVVDRIPFPDGRSWGCPGISLVVSAWSHHWLKDGLARRPADVNSESKVPLICMRLASRDEGGEIKISSVRLRPANTMFVNGLPYTMFADKWVINSEAVSGPMFSRQSARQSINRITFNHSFTTSSLTLPLQKLTEPREISVCMGNVISKLAESPDSEPTSASRELEERVSAFMKTQNTTNGTLAVFALIIPKRGAETAPIRGPLISTELLGYDKSRAIDGEASESLRSLDSVRLAISQGAHLHRVTSGGGGWGKKQGLLSLEPALDFESEEPESTPSWAPEASEGESGETRPFWAQSAVPETAHPGDMVQFYGTFLSKDAEHTLIRKESLVTASKVLDTSLWRSKTWADEELSKIVLGVAGAQDSSLASTLSPLGDELISISHQFGMLSEHGMALTSIEFDINEESTQSFGVRGERETNVTRIDVPHTVLTFSVRNRIAAPPQRKVEKTPKLRWRRVQTAPPAQSEPSYHSGLESLTPVLLAAATHQTHPESSPDLISSLDRMVENVSRRR